ncbi:hypothetical protein OIO90_000776 [Microbotryomycetes sp. JL221]|nr:hypothetical protein OIO90_000776 [Microbotryomycetes sp. JL221]
MSRSDSPGPHEGQKSLIWGDLNSPNLRCVVVFLHGRGSTADQDLPAFERTFNNIDKQTGKLAAVFMNAQDEAWYPEHWTRPRAAQEPFISSALHVVHETIQGLPVKPSQVVLTGFSQGATVSLAYVLTHPEVALDSVLAMSGSVIGSVDKDWPGDKVIDSATQIQLVWGSQDRYFKQAKVDEDVEAIRSRGLNIELDVLPMGHYVAQPELDKLEKLIEGVFAKTAVEQQ